MDTYALLGNPLGHSFSPLIHNFLFKKKNLDAKYILLETKKEDLKSRIDDLRNGIYKGFNVTIPYKVEVMQYLDEISAEAKEIGSVNTISFENGKAVGYNTDYYGFINELKYYNIDPKGKKSYVLGTGGASKAIYKALIDMKSNPILVSRHKDENTIDYEMLKDCDIDIVVNTTPVGMYPNIDASPLNFNVATKANVIVDIIFNPLKTKLMSYNKNSYNGLLMLIFQAMKAEDIWLNKEYDIDNEEIINYVRGEIGE